MSNHHIVINVPARRLQVFDMRTHAKLFECEARNDTVKQGYGHNGHCPPGDYTLGHTSHLDPREIPFGFAFTYLLDVNGLWTAHRRAGIGIHGGGTGLADPFEDRQGWMVTDGCIRLQNADNAKLFGAALKDAPVGDAMVTPGDVVTVFQGPAV